jgi:hypothetical protein
MAERERELRRGDPRERARRDVTRWQRRGGGAPFWQSLALIGSVGWPIVTLAVGGALLGHACDARAGGGVRFALAFLTLGTALGGFAAYRAVMGTKRGGPRAHDKTRRS